MVSIVSRAIKMGYIVDGDKEDVSIDENVVDLFIQDSNTIVL